VKAGPDAEGRGPLRTLGRGVMGNGGGAIQSIGGGWGEVIAERLKQTDRQDLEKFLASAWAPGGPEVYPCREHVFAAFEATPIDTVRAVILGQDPYSNPGQACGMAFSVPPGVPRPVSLRKIIRTVENDLSIEIAEDATLDPWASRGVLLLNTALTVLAGCPGNPTHRAVWRPLTRAVLEVLASRQESIAFLLWGAAAHAACDGLYLQPRDVFDAPHPASRYSPKNSRSFEAHHPFRDTTDRVDWEL